jgi:hypothetical protein
VCRWNATIRQGIGNALSCEAVFHEDKRAACRLSYLSSNIEFVLVANQDSEVIADGIDVLFF